MSFILFKIINHPNIVDVLISVLSPFFWAVLVSYLLNPVMVYLEKQFNFKRFWSILTVYTFLLGLLVLIIAIITPRIVESAGNILSDIPNYVVTTQKWLAYQIERLEFLGKYNIAIYLEETINSIKIEEITNTLNPLLNQTIIQAINITSGIVSLILGIVISVYVLKDKEKFIYQIKKLAYALFSNKRATRIIRFGKEFNIVFSEYLIGKMIDSLIIGIICLIGTLIIRVPYPLLISTIVGVTNMIPYFGPFIGMIPAVLITLFYNPIKALWMFIFILGLQQFDGLYLGPKILGTKLGLSPFWVITAIIVGGKLFGILGMLLAAPIGAIIKLTLERYIDNKLKNKNIKI
nr:AI-2E family transporter [Thermohalobacter berrensis]